MIFSARVCNFITANRYLRIGETLIPRRRFPFRNPAFVLYVREFQMQQELPFSIGFHTLFFLFTGCALPVLCISSVCLSRLLFSCLQVRNHSVLKGCMAPCLQLSLTLPSIDKAARWVTAYLTESSKSPASIARSNKQWVGTCLYQEWCKPLLISCEAAIRL